MRTAADCRRYRAVLLYRPIDLQYGWLDYAVGDAVRLIARGIAPRLAPVISGGGFFLLPLRSLSGQPALKVIAGPASNPTSTAPRWAPECPISVDL